MKNFVIVATSLILLALLLAVTACKEKNDRGPSPPPLPPIQTRIAFQAGIEPTLYELPSQALATWRHFAAYKPILVLFSTHPLLTPVEANRINSATKLLQEGTDDAIIRRSRTLTENPAILPPEAVSAAITANFFSEIVLVLPTTKKPEEVSLDSFRERALKSGFLSDSEAKGLRLDDGTIRGTVRGLPLSIPHPDKLPKLAKPILLHVDLGFFKDMYVNEVKTPAYDLIYQLVTNIQAADYQTQAATLSFSNQEIGFGLESRFLIRDLAEILRRPQLIGGNTPPSWTLRAQAMYASTLFNEDKARELTAQAVKTNPEDAAAHYALALSLFAQNLPEEGFAALDQAVALDRGYGLGYLMFAERAREMGKGENSIELLQKAAQAIPENPFIHRELAHQLIQASRVKEARPLIAELRRLDWSETFYPDIPPLLEKMAEAASVDVVLPKSSRDQETPSPPPERATNRMPGFNHKGMGY